jgi:hypothetical protein
MVDTLPAPPERITSHVSRYTRYWTTLITDAQHAAAVDPGLDPRILRELLIAAMNGTLRSTRTRRPHLAQVGHTLGALLLHTEATS